MRSILERLLPSLKRRNAVARPQPTKRARLEALESRCLLATTPMGEFLFAAPQSFGFTNSIFSGTRQADLDLPTFDAQGATDLLDGGFIPLPNKSEPDPPPPSPPKNNNPPIVNPPSVDPPKNQQPVDPIEQDPPQENIPGQILPGEGPDDSELIDLGSGSADVHPMDEPSPREVRSVFAMLAALKYSADGPAETVQSNVDNPFGLVRQQREQTRDLDGGTVAIAVSEIADELEAAPPQTAAAVQSLLEITIPMDRSAGRYQAFEVLTTEDVPLTPHDGPPVEYVPVSDDLSPAAGETRSATTRKTKAAAAQIRDGEPLGISAVPLTTAEELADTGKESTSAWSFTLGLVAFGFMLQLLPKKHSELLKSHARQIWHRLVAVTGCGRRKGKVAPFPEI